MLAKTETIESDAQDWLTRFGRTLRQGDVAALFHPDAYWRDVVALTGTIRTVHGAETIAKELQAHAGAAPTAFRLNPRRTAPRAVTRAGTHNIEAIFSFETAQGRGSGVLRLLPRAEGAPDGAPRAWTLLTALDEIKGHEEHVGRARPTGQSYSRDFRGPNWLDLRKAAAAYTDRDPAVLVVGGGQAGLSIAARLRQLDIDTLIVDREARIGDNWRNRYHALTLHNQVQVNHLPYMPFPPSWPTYIPKDKLAGWFESYVESLELNYWTGTELESGTYDEAQGRWTVALRHHDGTTRTMHPCHVVMATGVSGIPSVPDIPGLKAFTGEVLHASQYRDGEDWKGKRALVIGTGNSGHDIAQDLASSGASVTLAQRSPTLVVNIEPSAQLAYSLYDEGPSTEDCDLIATSMPFALVRKSHIALTEQGKQLDKDLLDALTRRGFKLDFGDDGSGWQFKYLTRGGGYYFNVGCSDMIADGRIALVQLADLAGFTAGGARMRNGALIAADLVVLATGYKGQEHLVRKLFGEAVAQRVGPIWGFDDAQDLDAHELRNMFVATPQPGLWFIAGSLAQCRIYSKYLALQIKARELELAG
jgi:cation diffusion facilitator CzcD-associated flavoprotein CzcO